jgi:hypothetical protein
MLDTTSCLDLNYYLFPEATIEGTIIPGYGWKHCHSTGRECLFCSCLMLLSVTWTSVKQKVEVSQQDVVLPSFSSYVQPNFIGPWVLCPLTFSLEVHKTCSSWNQGTGRQFWNIKARDYSGYYNHNARMVECVCYLNVCHSIRAANVEL